MREYVALHVLRVHRELPALQNAAARRRWKRMITRLASQRRVGVPGMGDLGGPVCETRCSLVVDMAGWSRSGAGPDGVERFAGTALRTFLSRCEILVCLLPLRASRAMPDGLRAARAIPDAHPGRRVRSDRAPQGPA